MSIISTVATAFISPAGAALIGGLLAILVGFAGRRRLAFGLGTLVLVWLWCWSLPVTSYAVRGYLGNQHPVVNASAMPDVVGSPLLRVRWFSGLIISGFLLS
tara:strand:+ start:42573 stop:42878 length:306 start_codon:yes stop_codon:yes gene_type:complete